MNKKGFTLIELLAVIVILAIIALIATPIILGVIEKSKMEAAESSALGYIDAVEKQMAINILDDTKTNITDGVYGTDDLNGTTYGVSVKGEKPATGSWVQVSNNQVVDYSLKIGDYVVNYNETDKKIESTKNGELENKPSGGSGETQITPKYFEFGTPNTSSATDFTTLGHNVFATLYSDGTTGGACINDNGTLFCIKANDYENSKTALKAHFEASSCTDDGSYFDCNAGDVGCNASSYGYGVCVDYSTNESCEAYADGSFYCY